MTREEFNAKFQILNQIADGSVRSYHALSSSGAVVMAHFLAGEPSAESSAILSRLDTLDPERKNRVVKITDVDGSPVVVTKFILDFESLQHWLELDTTAPEDTAAPVAEQAPPAAPETAPAPAPAEPTAPAELASDPDATLPFGPTTSGSESAPAQDSPANPRPTAAPIDEPGEFTRMFQVPSAGGAPMQESAPVPEAPAAPEPVPAPEAPPETAADGPSEFTRLFQAPLSAAPPAGTPPPRQDLPVTPPDVSAPSAGASAAEPVRPEPETEPADAPGEFTQLFRAAAPAEPAKPAEAPPPPAGPTPVPPGSDGPGEFTRMFQSPVAADATSRSPGEPREPLEPPRPTAPPPDSRPRPAAQAGLGASAPSLRNAVDRIEDVADVVDAAADLRLPEKRKVDLPSASPSLPGLNLNSPRSSTPSAPRSGMPSPPEPPKPTGGEFTQIFGQASAPSNPSPRMPAAPPPAVPGIGEIVKQAKDVHGYAERLQGMVGQRPQAPPPGVPPQPTPAPSPPSGAGEYTRIISAQAPPLQSAPSPPPPAPATAPPAAGATEAESGGPTWPLMVGLLVVLAIVVALVLYFVLRTP
jgi:hypothetical protein